MTPSEHLTLEVFWTHSTRIQIVTLMYLIVDQNVLLFWKCLRKTEDVGLGFHENNLPRTLFVFLSFLKSTVYHLHLYVDF